MSARSSVSCSSRAAASPTSAFQRSFKNRLGSLKRSIQDTSDLSVDLQGRALGVVTLLP